MNNLSFEFLKSKRFISALSYVLALVLVWVFPAFEGHEVEISGWITFIFGLLIAGYSIEDILTAIVQRTPSKVDDELLRVFIETFKGAKPAAPEVEVNVGGAVH